MILSNRDKYSISAMSKLLKIPRSLVYYHLSNRQNGNLVSKEEIELENRIIKIFRESRNNYGTRRIKRVLMREEIIVSRKKIRKIMNKYSLVSNYTIKNYKPHKTIVNNSEVGNIVSREFDSRESLEVIVSDLTYVRVANKWNYICVLLDLHNREVIGSSVGASKDANLVHRAFMDCSYNLTKISIFHTDRGNEFKNRVIEEVIDGFGIMRSLSNKGCPYDNAVAESFYKTLKTEFVGNKEFETIEQLEYELKNYINWYNNFRLHSSLNYLTPIEFKNREAK